MKKPAAGLHSFVISAWKESPYIEETLRSLLGQTYPSEVIVATSSPNDFLKNLCSRYSVPYVVNPDAYMAESQINWSFAYAQAKTKYVTLAHQDDVYPPEYAMEMVAAAEKHPDAVLAFSRCANWRNGKLYSCDWLLLIKDLLLFPYYFNHAIASKFVRKMCLSFGNPICCPTIMFHKERIGKFTYDSNIPVNFDWDALLRLSSYDGRFVFCPKNLLWRRIHDESGTTITYQDGRRQKDDLALLCRIWPKPIAVILNKLYSLSCFLN